MCYLNFSTTSFNQLGKYSLSNSYLMMALLSSLILNDYFSNFILLRNEYSISQSQYHSNCIFHVKLYKGGNIFLVYCIFLYSNLQNTFDVPVYFYCYQPLKYCFWYN